MEHHGCNPKPWQLKVEGGMGQGHVTKVAHLWVNSTSTFASDVMCDVTMCVNDLMDCHKELNR